MASFTRSVSALAMGITFLSEIPCVSFAFLHVSHHHVAPRRAHATAEKTRVGAASSLLRSEHRRTRKDLFVCSRSRNEHLAVSRRIRQAPSHSSTEWTLSAATEDDREGGEAFIPTEDLLDDPSHLERILASMAQLAPAVPPLDRCVFETAVTHHCAIRTSNIVRAMKFYSILGMKEVVRFRAESARCAFLEGAGTRLELIEVPASMRPEDKAEDLSTDMRSTGLNHIAFDVGPAIEAEGLDGLRGFLSELNRQSEEAFGMSVKLAVSPYEQRIGQEVFDLAFIMDADGVLLELVHRKATLDIHMPQAW